MTLNRLRLMAIFAPITFVILIGVLMDQVLEQALPRSAAHLLAVGIISAGALLFALWVFALLGRSQGKLEQQQREAREQAQTVARLEERDRIGVGLHDEVIQSIYGIQLALEDCQQRILETPEKARSALDQAIDDLTRVVATTRRYIFGLRPYFVDAEDLPRALKDLVEEFRVNTMIPTEVMIEELIATSLCEEQAALLFQTAQTTLDSIRRDGTGAPVIVSLTSPNEAIALLIRVGSGSADPDDSSWVDEISRQAQALGGSLTTTKDDRGMTISLRFPIGESR